MFEYIQGKIIEKTPAYAVIEANQVGYFIHISLTSFSQLQDQSEIKLFIHFAVREDAQVLYGFTSKTERQVFRHLISVSGIGPNTARMILSSMPPLEVEKAIFEENVGLLKSVKGIGAKTAQRVIIDLKDKVGTSFEDEQFEAPANNTLKIEALSALEVLGFAKKNAEKAVDKLLEANPVMPVEHLIKQALKVL